MEFKMTRYITVFLTFAFALSLSTSVFAQATSDGLENEVRAEISRKCTKAPQNHLKNIMAAIDKSQRECEGGRDCKQMKRQTMKISSSKARDELRDCKKRCSKSSKSKRSSCLKSCRTNGKNARTSRRAQKGKEMKNCRSAFETSACKKSRKKIFDVIVRGAKSLAKDKECKRGIERGIKMIERKLK